MMLAIEIVCLCLIAALCYLCTKSDLQSGIIYNKVLVTFWGLAIVIDAVYYGIFVRDLCDDFLLNFIIVAAVSLYLFYSHSFAGGDCKMMMVIALLFPARFYWVIGSSNVTLVLIIAYAIFAGYCYLLGRSIWSIATKKVIITFDYIKKYLFNFLKSYVVAMVYIALLNQIIVVISKWGVNVNVWIIRSFCLILAWCIGRYPLLKKWIMFVPVIGSLVVISIFTKTIPFSLNLENYALVLVLLVCQMTIKTTIYEKIEVEKLRKGMILTTFSSMLMQTSITKGLPGVSTEDLKSRLTVEEIESIKIWAKATHTESLTIVKKIPFAIFISIGVLLYCAMWGLVL